MIVFEPMYTEIKIQGLTTWQTSNCFINKFIMKILCGPEYDKRIFTLTLPESTPYFKSSYLTKLWLRSHKLRDNNHIGILVSGGVDSAILYYTLLKENFETVNRFKITPYTILRKEGSKHYAIKVINWIQNYFNIAITDLNIIGNPSLPEIKQVESGVLEILTHHVDYVYLGIIESRPEHSINWVRPLWRETFNLKYPLLNLEKSHVIDLYRKFNLFDLLKITHSCALNEIDPCGTCNGCLERQWGLSELGFR